ncbi:beta-methylgalactoside transporter inner membrane protein [Actinobacillus equuli]|nr:beta-methylgalactoside transporter inner membrane protein [Actinobacillus equuli]
MYVRFKTESHHGFFKQNAIYFVLLILLIVIIVQDPSFLSLRNFSNILSQSSVRLIIALGLPV